MENNENNARNPKHESAVTSLRNRMQDARKEGMTRGLLIAGAVSFIILLAAGIFVYSHYEKRSQDQLAQMDDQKLLYSNQLIERDSLINEWLVTFNQIENDLNAIKQKENIITVQSSDSEISKSSKEQILEDIKYINALLENNKKKIASLNAQLKKSGGMIKGLQDKVASLENSVRQYEKDVTDLKMNLVQKDFEIGQLNTKMSDLELTLVQQDEKINDQTAEMNKAFLVSGTYKELKEKGLVVKEGGFLGLGRKESLIEDFTDSTFTRVDITEVKAIPVNTRNVRLITEHPSESYELVRESRNKIASIEIRNPEEFWKISKYAVVELIK